MAPKGKEKLVLALSLERAGTETGFWFFIGGLHRYSLSRSCLFPR